MSEETPTPPTEDAATVPSYRLREETDRRTKAEESAKSAMAAYADLESKYKTLQQDKDNAVAKHSQDMSLFSVGIQDSEVREFVRSRYNSRDDQSVEFNDWLGNQTKNPSPLLAPFLKAQQPAAEEAVAPPTPAAPPAAPNPNIGTTQPNSHVAKLWSSDELAVARKKNGGGLGTNKDAIIAQLRAEGLIK